MARASRAAAALLVPSAALFVFTTARKHGVGVAGVEVWRTLEPWGVVAPLALIAAAVGEAMTRRFGRCCVTAGGAILWQLARIAGSGDVPARLRSAGWYAAALLVPTLGQLVQRRSRILWLAPALAGVVWAASYDPFTDLRCTTYCAPNRFALRPDPGLARAMVVLAGCGAAALLVRACVEGFRRQTPVTAVGALLLAAVALAPAAQTLGHGDVARVLMSLGCLAALPLAATPLRDASGRLRRLTALRRLAGAMSAGSSSSLQEGLRDASGDPTLIVAYEHEGGRLLGADGRPWAPRGRPTVRLVDADRTVAVIEHAGTLDAADVTASFGPAARLAAWNEALDAELEQQLTAVRESRRRVVEAEDRERRRLERDLHDDVQQRLLAVLFELRRAERDAPGDVAEASAHVAAALAAVREIAAGTYPTVIEQSGLEASLHTAIERGARPVDLRVEVPAGCPIAAAVGRTVHDAVQAVAGERDSEPASIAVRVVDGRVELTVRGTGRTMTPTFEDRVAALGGRVETTSDGWECRLPCA